MTLLRKIKNKASLPIFSRSVLNLAEKKRKKSYEHSQKKHGTGKPDSERKNCANTFPRVRKQTLLIETCVCIGYASFHKLILRYRLTVKLFCASEIEKC